MSDSSLIEPLNKNVHGKLRLKRKTSLAFAASSHLASLTADELPAAALSLPLALVARARGDDGAVVRYEAAAVLGLRPGQNLFLDAQQKWNGAYVPVAFRAYPFVLGRKGEADQERFLAVRRDPELLSEEGEGEPLFDAAGEPTALARETLDLLVGLERSRAKAARALAALAEAQLIVPLNLTLRAGEKSQRIEGLFGVDEKALNALPDEAYLKLRHAGAVALAHLLLLSQQNFQALGTRAKAQRQAEVSAAPAQVH